jgi:hypothetical protein
MDNDRHRIDPDNRYPADGLRAVERAALGIVDWRRPVEVSRGRDVIEIRFPDPGDEDLDLTVLVTGEAIELRLPTIEWTMGSFGPARSSELWKRLPLSEIPAGGAHELLGELHRALLRRLRTCKHCRRRFLPARMTRNSCHGCASDVEGVVY